MSVPSQVLAERAANRAERKGAFGWPPDEIVKGNFIYHLVACPTCNIKLENKNAR